MSNLIYKFLKLFQPVESSIDSSDNIIVESNIGTCNIIGAEKKKKYAKDKYYEHIKLSAIAYLVSTIVVIIMLILLDSIGEGAMAGFLKGGILWAPLIVVILIGAFFAAYSTYMDPLSDNGYFTKKMNMKIS